MGSEEAHLASVSSNAAYHKGLEEAHFASASSDAASHWDREPVGSEEAHSASPSDAAQIEASCDALQLEASHWDREPVGSEEAHSASPADSAAQVPSPSHDAGGGGLNTGGLRMLEKDFVEKVTAGLGRGPLPPSSRSVP